MCLSASGCVTVQSSSLLTIQIEVDEKGSCRRARLPTVAGESHSESFSPWRDSNCEVLLCVTLLHLIPQWYESSATRPISHTRLLSLPLRLECATCQDAEITSAFSLFPFCAGVSASLYPPLLSLFLCLSLPLSHSLSLPLPLALSCYFTC